MYLDLISPELEYFHWRKQSGLKRDSCGIDLTHSYIFHPPILHFGDDCTHQARITSKKYLAPYRELIQPDDPNEESIL